MLAPRSRLIGETLRSTNFRERYGVTVLAIWRGTQEIVIDMAETRLVFGDALLIQGTREKLATFGSDPDIIVLMEGERTAITVPERGRLALLIFIATLILAIFLPDITGAVMLGGAITMIVFASATRPGRRGRRRHCRRHRLNPAWHLDRYGGRFRS